MERTLTIERRITRPTGELDAVVIDHCEDEPTARHVVGADPEAAALAAHLTDRLAAERPHAVARVLESEADRVRRLARTDEGETP